MTTLDIPAGIYWIINPFQESQGVLAKLSGAKQKYPDNLEGTHPTLQHFYGLLKSQDFGVTVDVILFWFANLRYSSIAVGPFGLNSTEQMNMEMQRFRQFCKEINVPKS